MKFNKICFIVFIYFRKKRLFLCSVKLFKVTVHTKMKIVIIYSPMSFHICLTFPVEHKGRYFEKCLSVFQWAPVLFGSQVKYLLLCSILENEM